jgi:antitoxin ParD1/3/4
MNVSLTPDLENLIRDKLDTGLYASASEVVREALRLMFQHDENMKYKERLNPGATNGLSFADAVGHDSQGDQS